MGCMQKFHGQTSCTWKSKRHCKGSIKTDLMEIDCGNGWWMELA
jgi:hypothetical protein